MSEKDADTASHDDSPELTDEDFARAISLGEVMMRRAERERATSVADERASIAFDMDADLVRTIKAIGPDYGTRVEAVLREALAEGRL